MPRSISLANGQFNYYKQNNNTQTRIKRIMNKITELTNKIKRRVDLNKSSSTRKNNQSKLNKLEEFKKRMEILEHKENNKLKHVDFQKFMNTFKSLQPLLRQSRSDQLYFKTLPRSNQRSILAQLNPNTNFINKVDLPMLSVIRENNNN